jgi:putative N-acetylmannosamine-6-phosphate epimerase
LLINHWNLHERPFAMERNYMLIRVRYKDGRIDLVPSEILDEMILMSDIERIETHNSWVVLGEDPVRSTLRGRYYGLKPQRKK